MHAPDLPAADAAWPLWQRLAFRYLLCHAVLYMLPMPLSNLVQTLASLLDRLDRHDAVHWPWLGKTVQWLVEQPMTWFGELAEWWRVATAWAAEHGLMPIDVIQQEFTGSGDTSHDFARVLLIVIVSLAVTAAWSAFARRPRAYPTLGRWLHLGARWYLAFAMIGYGTIKLYSGQFPEPSLTRLSNEIGDTSPMGMVWTFLGASRPYEVFGGLGELAAGLLLFHRRTALLGCLVTIAVMSNVCAMNWLYDVPVKLYSTHLLLFAVCLLAPWASRLQALLVSNRSSQPVDMNVTRWRWLQWPLVLFGWLWAISTLVEAHFANSDVIEIRAEDRVEPKLYGRWDVAKMLIDGKELPVGDATRWQFLAIDKGMRAWIRTGSNTTFNLGYTEDLDADTVTLTAEQGGAAMPCTIEQGTTTIEALHPNPRLAEERRQRIDVERRTLVLKGDWNGQPLEVHTVQHVFELHRGFHWVQEVPVNR